MKRRKSGGFVSSTCSSAYSASTCRRTKHHSVNNITLSFSPDKLNVKDMEFNTIERGVF